MTDLLLATTPTSLETSVIELVVSLLTLILLMVVLVLDLKYIRASRKLAKSLNLPQGQWLRPAMTLAFDPAIEVVAIGLVLGEDLVQNWEHMVIGVVGAIVGLWVGHYRFRIQYVRALPEHKAIVFVRSRAEYVALSILLLVSFASEQHQIPVVGPLTLLITLGLSLVLFESIGRSWFSYQRYKQEMSAYTQQSQSPSVTPST